MKHVHIDTRNCGAWRLRNDFFKIVDMYAHFLKRYDGIAEKLCHTEDTLEDKLACDAHFSTLRQFKVPTLLATRENLDLIRAEYAPEFIVVKPRYGSRGAGVNIISASEARESEGVAEPFVPSKKIFCPETANYHDGCMRYVVLVEKPKNGALRIYHFSGYWRLCPKPIKEYGDVDAMRANFCQRAIPVKASDNDLELARSSVESFVPIFYNSMIGQRCALRELSVA